MYFAFGDLLNYFTPDVRPQFTIFNKSIEMEKFKEEVLFPEKDDPYNELRQDLNKIILSKISEGQNSVVQEKYLTVSVRAENIEIANSTFARIDGELAARIKAINEATTDPMELEERLELLYNIYNQDDVPFFRKMNIDGNEARTFDLEWMHQLGLTTKDMVGPNSLIFENDHFRLGDKYGRALFLKNLPTQLSAEILTDIANVPCNALTSVHLSPMRQDEAIKLVRNQMLEITRNMATAAKRAAKNGLGAEFLSPDIVQAKKDADKAYEDITVRDQKSFLMTVVAVIFADDLYDLDKYTKIIQNNAEKHLCTLSKLNAQQERGFSSALPLGNNKIWADRLMNTEAAALFVPFESQELIQSNGLYYGVNATSRNIIIINRLKGQNSNSLIFGMPGSGKSLTAKLEMTGAFLADEKNHILVLDPQSEYKPICEAMSGLVLRIAPGAAGRVHMNPFDLDISYGSGEGDDPVTAKSDYICSICESALGGHYGLNPVQISVIDRCIRKLYEPYMAHMDHLHRSGRKITCDRDAAPVFPDFYYLLGQQPEPEAEYIQLAIEKYCLGSFDTFAYRTNVNTDNRFTVYDIHDIGTGMKELGMKVCLNDIWSRTIANHAKGIRTWVYIDELYILTHSEACARLLLYIFKQIRKFGGAPTGIVRPVSGRKGQIMMINIKLILRWVE